MEVNMDMDEIKKKVDKLKEKAVDEYNKKVMLLEDQHNRRVKLSAWVRDQELQKAISKRDERLKDLEEREY